MTSRPNKDEGDMRALELFEKANQQFERFVELSRLSVRFCIDDPPQPAAPTWDHPLDLIIQDEQDNAFVE